MNKNNYTTNEVLDRPTRYGCVMLIDDNPMDNLINQKMVEKDNFAKHVLVHEKAQSALEFLASADETSLPDLIFLDINMPEMDGFQFLDAFARLPEHIGKKSKIIMLSTSDSFKDLNRANQNKFVCKFLNKPLTDEILTAINI
jgi:CheY-like chemotaxis protein